MLFLEIIAMIFQAVVSLILLMGNNARMNACQLNFYMLLLLRLFFRSAERRPDEQTSGDATDGDAVEGPKISFNYLV